ncbi:hypothetical protein L7F22_029299 [Adiantum nelumboides]|nr:hypothetical protein [Adiantum nelumboides]
MEFGAFDGYNQITGVSMVQHHINLKDGAKLVVQRLQRLGVIQQDALLSEVRKLLNAGFIYPVEDSKWVSLVVVTPKKNGKWRVCVDYKPLNATTKRNHFPLPFQDEILNEVAGYERKPKVKSPGLEQVEVKAELSGAHSLYFDGAYKRKVDKASMGISIQDENGQEVFGKGLLVENTHSNNEAKYAALALGLEWKGNQEADALASEQLQEVIVGAIKLQNPLFQGSDCMHEIVNFLEAGKCAQDMSKDQRQWLIRKATKYRIINEHLYCKGKDLVLRRVPHSKDIKQVLTSCHEGVCGGHFAHAITSRKILQIGFVWLSLHRDVQHWCKACKQCQLAGDRHFTYEPQTPILSYGPFEKWGIDAIGPLPRSNSGQSHFSVGFRSLFFFSSFRPLLQHSSDGIQDTLWY